ncbi:MAG: phosphoglycerate dehydrogenase [Candidatus Omnitrophica bacterium]|nr:phosphoglycerate dehydrogenase [Candidatus Omnitrophota bacterium]MBU1047825.1 phosphoglycerate dehydrogenase [Candidatus Omnitrophota bacterium]MBU1631104.1 phosphoglycerate dehydrogenase [Candidatus Omnitrophota bacterium]MBU1767548.1 phosphoglycerate dehydrogenase [Candidatus Omnitrophota bacterium]MBU1889212.1 phosphoglycerate dehydrogenase [Candidatus Omnitrophota bacterium]
MKVLISDKLEKQAVDILQAEGLQVDINTELTPEQLKEKIKGYDALIVRSKTKATKEIIDASDNLKVIGRAGVGVDNIDIPAATAKGIVVMNAPSGNTISAAEHAFALMMSLSRNIPYANSLLKNKKWEKKLLGVELNGKTIGVIGLGRVGSHMAKMAKGIGMKVIGYDPLITEDKASSVGVALVSLDEIFKTADFISLHVPRTPETKNLIGEDALNKMKKNVRIINCARGGVVDEDALYKALKEGKIAGAALDVFAQEPLLDSPLLELDNVIVTPHLGASTQEAQIKVAVDIANSIALALKEGKFNNALNLSQIKR